MKKIIYLSLLAMLAISFGCETDEILVNEQNEIIDEPRLTGSNQSRNSIDSDISDSKPISSSINMVPLVAASSTTTGLGNDGSGNEDPLNDDGMVFDGTNYNNGPPNGYHWTILITYSQGITEFQKREYRARYQATGELWYFEQCPNDPQKEIWYFVPGFSAVPCPFPFPYSCSRGDNPPSQPPRSFAIVLINENCND